MILPPTEMKKLAYYKNGIQLTMQFTNQEESKHTLGARQDNSSGITGS